MPSLTLPLAAARRAIAALQQHQLWGSLLIGLQLCGPGRWSVDARLARAFT